MNGLVPVVSIVSLSISPRVSGQGGYTVREGDSTVVAAITAQARILYELYRGTALRLYASECDRPAQGYGTEVSAGLRVGVPVRVIVEVWTPQGKFSAEYYWVRGELIFVYETIQWFREVAAPGWRNLTGLGGWERRTDLTGGRVAFVETAGEGAPPSAAYPASSIALIFPGSALKE